MRQTPSINSIVTQFVGDEITDGCWLKYGAVEVYVRKAIRDQVRGQQNTFQPSLEIGNWHRQSRTRRPPVPGGAYRREPIRELLDVATALELAASTEGWSGVWIESVFSEQIRRAFAMRGYEQRQRVGCIAPSMFMPVASIIRQSSLIPDLRKSKLSRAGQISTRAFLRDPTVRRHWIIDEVRGTKMLVKRELVDRDLVSPTMRVTVLKFVNGTLNDDVRSPLMSFVDHEDAIRHAIALLSRGQTGRAQIAISTDAACIQSLQPASRRRLGGPPQWLADVGFTLEPQSNPLAGRSFGRFAKRVA